MKKIRPGLVLSRRPGEVIVIEPKNNEPLIVQPGECFYVSVLEVSRGQLRIGISAPDRNEQKEKRKWNIARGEQYGITLDKKPP